MTCAAAFRSRPPTRFKRARSSRAAFALPTKFPNECTYLLRRIS
jgi:hypothetical protein